MWHGRTFEVVASGIFGGRRHIVAPSMIWIQFWIDLFKFGFNFVAWQDLWSRSLWYLWRSSRHCCTYFYLLHSSSCTTFAFRSPTLSLSSSFLGPYLYPYPRGSRTLTKQTNTNTNTNENLYNSSYPGSARPPKNISVTNLVILAIDVIIVKNPPRQDCLWCTVRQFYDWSAETISTIDLLRQCLRLICWDNFYDWSVETISTMRRMITSESSREMAKMLYRTVPDID